MSLKEKFENYLKLIKEKEDCFINSIENKITKLYEINLKNEINELIINFYYYYNEKDFDSYKKITKKDLKEIEDYYNNIQLSLNKVKLSYSCIKNTQVQFRSRIYLDDIKKYFLTLEDAQNQVNILKNKEIEKQEMLKNGYIECTYCKKLILESESIQKQIISFQNYGKNGIIQKFCNSTCATYQQMSLEG